MVAAEYRLNHWAGIMRERKESGQSIRAYCKAGGICENVYYYWQKKLRETACDELLPPEERKAEQTMIPSGWAAVCETKESVGAAGGIHIEIGKCHVTATADMDAELLAKVCRMLVGLC